MKLFRRLSDIILFRSTIEIETDLSCEVVKNILIERFKSDQSFLYPVFEDFKFSFIHRSFMPKFNNYSPVISEGEIRNQSKTLIFISVKQVPIFFLWFVFGILCVLIFYNLNYDGFKDEFANTPFPLNPIYSPLLILIPYGYYASKTNNVKRIIKSIMFKEEKRSINESIAN